jgi:adenylosuccinate synthase
MGTVDVVVGGQYGSEAKGHVTAQLTRRRIDEGQQVHVVRVAGPNAGHTAYGYLDQRPYALRTIPCAAVVHPDIQLYIATGSEIDLDVLSHEIEMLETAGYPIRDRLHIDGQATILTAAHIATETQLDIHKQLGSTGKGIGAARADRIMRRAAIWADLPRHQRFDLPIADTRRDLWGRLRRPNHTMIIEGTQGYGLGLHAGDYPFCTSSDCRAIDFLAMVGISPWDPVVGKLDIWIAVRTYPIRVAGNSGPLRDELDWADLAERTGGYIKPERTTVTQKIRRVGEYDASLVGAAIRANGGPAENVHLALTFADYLDPQLAGATTLEQLNQSTPVCEFIVDVMPDRVHLVCTGPDTAVWLGDGQVVL